VDDIRAALRAGADKVSLNTAAINRPDLIGEAARRFGSSAVVVSIEAVKRPDGTYEAMTDNGRQPTGVEAIDWARRIADLGAGEIIVTSIDREGTGKGFDLDLTRAIATAVPVPVIACGGAGALEHVGEAAEVGQADAVCVASLLHYHVIQRDDGLQRHTAQGNTEYLKSRRPVSHLRCASVPELKEHLIRRGISCREPASGGVHA
jgi:cyclase